MPGKGIAITLAEKKLVIQVKRYFDEAKKRHLQKESNLESSVFYTALATGLSEVAVSRIITEYNKDKLSAPAAKGSKPYSVDESIKTICQDTIRSHNIYGIHISIRILVGILNDKHKIEIPRETLRSYLHRWNIIYGSIQRHTALRERDDVVNARREYLIRKKELNNSDRTLVYLDETFVNKNYSGSDKSWYCDDWQGDPSLDKSFGPYVNKPSGKGDRFIILNAITDKGWIDGAKLIFKAKTNSGDYHGSMDEDNFTKWFRNQLLPNIPDNSVIIMDNASYHNVFSYDGVPSLKNKKEHLQKWLNDNKIPFEDDFLRTQLIALINTNRSARSFKLDDMLKNEYKDRNIEILRTPQYHPELQPIEKCWAVMKQHIAQHCDFTIDGLRNNLEKAWKKVTSKTMDGIIKKMLYWETYHFEQDNLLDAKYESELPCL